MAKRTYNRRGRKTAKKPVTTSARRQQRIKGAQVARKTGSKDKMTVSGQRSIKGGPRGAQGPRTAPQQGPSRKPKGGLIGTRKTPATKTTTKPPGIGNKPKFDPRVRTAAKVGTILNPRSDIPAKLLAAGSLAADAYKALRRPKAKAKPKKMASMGSNYKAQEKKLSRAAGAANFDSAFAKARKAGKKTFTWRGKKYTTKLKK